MKNKKILIISILAVVLIIAIAIGVLYFATDIFKTEKQIFYKYISKTPVTNSSLATQYNAVTNKISKNSSSSTMNLEVSYSMTDSTTGAVETQNVLNISSNGLKNISSNQNYNDFTISMLGQEFLKFKYLKDDNTYGIFVDNILSKYLSVENSNLKELVAKLGVEDTSEIPDSIPTNYGEILKIDDATLESLKTTYGNLIYNNISEENFYKIANEDKTETIGLTMTEQELFNILKVILETVKNDEVLLNLIISKAQMLNSNDITIENIQEGIQESIDDISNDTYSTDKDFIKIELTKKGKNILKLGFETNYKEENTMSQYETEEDSASIKSYKYNIDLDFSESNKVSISTKENDVETSVTTILYSYNENDINVNIEIESKEQEESNLIKLEYKLNNYQTDNITQNILIDVITSEDMNYQVNITNNTTLKQDVEIPKLTTENSVKLNDLTSNELSELFEALANRIMTVYGGYFTTPDDSLLEAAEEASKKMEQAMEAEDEALKNIKNH